MKISTLPNDTRKVALKTVEKIQAHVEEDTFTSSLLASCDTPFSKTDIFTYFCKEIVDFFSSLNILKARRLKKAEYNILCGIKYGSMKYNPVFYNMLSDDALKLARHETTFERIVAKENIHATIELKNHLDKKFGRGGYSIACIGRSPSTLSRCFSLLGVDTKYCPITELWGGKEAVEKIMKQKGIENYINYLKRQGISKEALNQSNKKLLFLDYTESGKSLKLFSEMMEKGLDLPKDKIEFISINDLMFATTDNYSKTKTFVDKYFGMSEAHRFGGVPKLCWNKLGDIYTAQLDELAYISYNRFLFATQDIIEQVKKMHSN